MNVYDTANRLASEIRESNEYKEYKKAKEEITSNPETKNKVSDFEKLRYEVQLLDYQGKGESEDKAKKLQEMYTMLVQDKKIKEYFDLEVKFNVMIADIFQFTLGGSKLSLRFINLPVCRSKFCFCAARLSVCFFQRIHGCLQVFPGCL